MNSKKTYKGTKNALILTGGGARAAYQVGVLSAIAKMVPRNHGTPCPIICGTSAGAINATALACYASCFHLGVKKLEWVWKNLTTEHIYSANATDVFGYLSQGILASFQADYANKQPHSLLNNQPLKRLLTDIIDFNRIDANILNGYLTALSVTASSYNTGDSISFYQSNETIKPWKRAKRLGIPTKIKAEHLMASSAIPIVFPSVKIQQQHFGDGSIHQLSPLSTAIHLGAEQLLVVGVEQQPIQTVHANENTPHPPSIATIAGHLLDSIFADTLQSDLERMQRINQTLSLIPTNKRKQVEGLKTINSLVLNPSHNFNLIALKYLDDLPVSIRLLLRTIGVNTNSESSILSYLLFEKNYCRELIQLGFADAMEQESQIKTFLALS